ncbi:MerR family transcriptional regulator [Bacillus sp. 2205SS5-2]|uniref:MerR family transcriptional regulator n=1 Tax=Bacillus sp. 2205SS5-2 TaxID=3109031 RepID=UPI00300443FE
MKNQIVTISNATKILKITPHILKSWEITFTPLLTIRRDENNARQYTPENLHLLRRISELKKQESSDSEIILIIQSEIEREKKIKREQEERIARAQRKIRDQEKTERVSPKNLEDIYESVQQLTTIVSRTPEEKDPLQPHLEKLEENIVSKVRNIVHKEVTSSAAKQNRVNTTEFSSISHKVDTLREISQFEREFYQDELQKERDQVTESVADREEKFIALVQDRLRNRPEQKEETRLSFHFLKTLFGFAK